MTSPLGGPRIVRAVTEAEASGLLTHRPLPDQHADEYRTDRILIGRTPDDERVYVEARLTHYTGSRRVPTTLHERHLIDGRWQTVHGTATDRWALSLQGRVIRKGGNPAYDGAAVATGQVTDYVRRVPRAEPLLAAWERDHLNDLRAGCELQVPRFEATRGYVRPDLVNIAPCPETGYEYGSAWLYQPLGPRSVETVLSFLAQAKADTPRPAPYRARQQRREVRATLGISR